MTTVKVKFRPSTVAGRPGSIVYFITQSRITRQITTGYKVFPDEWDKKRAKPVSPSDNERTAVICSITDKLRRDMAQIDRIIKRFDQQSLDYSPDDIITEFYHANNENTLFFFMENTIS